MVIQNWNSALVGHKSPESQAILDRVRLLGETVILSLLPVPAQWKDADGEHIDPCCIQVWARCADGTEAQIGKLENRARCDACDPDRRYFGYVDCETSVCPRCGAPLTRGIAAQAHPYLKPAFRVVAVISETMVVRNSTKARLNIFVSDLPNG